MSDRIEMGPRVNLDQVLHEGPSLAERATQVAVKALQIGAGTSPSEDQYLKQAWNNLKSSLVGFSTYGIMNQIEEFYPPHAIRLIHFKMLANELKFNIEELSVDQLPLGIYSFA